jgi:hypothetical protein
MARRSKGKARTTTKPTTAKPAAKAAAKPHDPSTELVTVEGRAPRAQTFNLPHDVYCAAMGECACVERTVATSKYTDVEGGKKREVAYQQKLICSSFTVLHRRRVTVTRAALLCPEVKTAIQRKWLRVRS